MEQKRSALTERSGEAAREGVGESLMGTRGWLLLPVSVGQLSWASWDGGGIAVCSVLS